MGNSSNMASASDAQVDSLERMANQMGAGGRMRIRITQDAFDDAVKETMDDFEMEFDEAVQETIEQFQTQGVDLGGLRLDDPTVRAEGGKALRNACVQIRDAVAKVESGEAKMDEIKDECLAAFKKLDEETPSEEKRNEACSHGVIASLGGCIGNTDPEIVRGALQSMTNLLQTYSAREGVSQSTVNMVVSVIRQHPTLAIDAIKTLTVACNKDEPNKSRVECADQQVEGVIREAGMEGDCDVSTMPKMGKTNMAEDKPQISECGDGCCHDH